MRKLIAAVLFAAAPALVAQTETDTQKIVIEQGIQLFDSGHYDEAAKNFQAVLAQNPKSVTAAHELALTYTAQSKFAQCRDLLQPLVKNAGANEALLFSPLGNCLDSLGKSAEAEKVYRRGLALRKDDPQLSFNLAVTLFKKGKLDEARELLKTDLRQRPGHVSAHYALGQIYKQQNFRIPATLELLRFLGLESGTDRSKAVAGQVLELLNAGVKRTGEKSVQLAVDPHPRTEEGDYSALEMMWAISAGAAIAAEKEQSQFQRTVTQMSGSLAMLVEGDEAKPGFVGETEVPFFREIYRANQLDAFAAIALHPLQLPGDQEWSQQHAEELGKMIDWLSKHRGDPAIAVP